MSYRTLKIKVDAEDLQVLRERGYNLCLARDVGGHGVGDHRGNVVLSVVEDKHLAPSLTLEWAIGDRFQVFGTEEFEVGSQIKPDTDVAEIRGGQKAIINPNGKVKVTGIPQPGEPFHVENRWKQGAHIGINSFDTNNNRYTSFYVSPPVLLLSTTDLLPLQMYSVFWDMDLVPNTVFDPSTVPAFSFDLTHKDEITLQYKYGDWSIVA